MEKEIFKNNRNFATKNTQTKSSKKQIPFLKGRPKRGTVIGGDDLTNLRIALHTAKTLDEFLVAC